MKTLTMVEALVKAKVKEEKMYWNLERGNSVEGGHAIIRQVVRFKTALTKRLQEQEEELERLREIDGAVEREMYQCCDEYTKGENK